MKMTIFCWLIKTSQQVGANLRIQIKFNINYFGVRITRNRPNAHPSDILMQLK